MGLVVDSNLHQWCRLSSSLAGGGGGDRNGRLVIWFKSIGPVVEPSRVFLVAHAKVPYVVGHIRRRVGESSPAAWAKFNS